MAWKPEVLVENKWTQNSLNFATEQEAKDSARDLMNRWFVVIDSRAVEVPDTNSTHTYLHDDEKGGRVLKSLT